MMVFCSKCGYKNLDDAKFCINCGANLVLRTGKQKEDLGEEIEKKVEKWGEGLEKRMDDFGDELGKNIEDECFGLPHGGAIIGIIIGAFIIIIGTSLALGLNFDIWGRWFGTGILIIIGIIIVVSAIYGLTRKRR